MRWRCSSSAVTLCVTGSICAELAAETISVFTVVSPVSRSIAEVYGMSTMSSWS